MSWSYNVLPDGHAKMFRLLSLMPGPTISVAGAAALTGLPLTSSRDMLRDLADAHLVQQYTPGRYRMHDLVRLYAAECALSDADTADAERRLLLFYLNTAYVGERIMYPHRKSIAVAGHQGELPVFRGDAEVLAWFEAELPGLLAAQEIAVVRRWDVLVWQFGWVLHGYLWRSGMIYEQLATWRVGLVAAQRLGNLTAQSLAHRLYGQTATRAGRSREAKDHLEQALALAREVGDRHGEARAHYDLAATFRHDGEAALLHAGLALQLFKELENPVWQAEALEMIGRLHARNGNLKGARVACERALELFSQQGNRQGQATAMTSLGLIACRAGTHSPALTLYSDSLTLYRELGARYEEAETLEHLGRLHVALGQHEDAERALRKALRLYIEQRRTRAADGVRRQLGSVTASAQVV